MKIIYFLGFVALIVTVVTGESDFERRYGKYIRCKHTHKPTDDELETYNNADSICRQRAKHALNSDAGDDFHNKINCVNHCVRNHTPSNSGDHVNYCVQAVDKGSYSSKECSREF